jgi:hypothetical protein
MSLLLTEYTKVIQNEIHHVQCTTRNAVMPFYKSTNRQRALLHILPTG